MNRLKGKIHARLHVHTRTQTHIHSGTCRHVMQTCKIHTQTHEYTDILEYNDAHHKVSLDSTSSDLIILHKLPQLFVT